MICCTRITLVTAAIDSDGPMRSSHSSAARAMGSNGNGRDVMAQKATSWYTPEDLLVGVERQNRQAREGRRLC
jgi:hypothetical protein